jgi:hypothetical protein
MGQDRDRTLIVDKVVLLQDLCTSKQILGAVAAVSLIARRWRTPTTDAS